MPLASGSFPISRGSGVDNNVVNAVFNQAKAMNASRKVTIALFEACLVESNFRNIAYGDRDSVGVLQQRSSGWGTYAERMNPASAAKRFIERAKQLENKYSSPGRLAQAVQVSAFPSRYDQRQSQAESLLKKAEETNGKLPTINGGLDDLAPGTPTDTTVLGQIDMAVALLSDRSTWLRVLLILIGLILLIMGLMRVSMTDDKMQVAKAALNFIPGGKVGTKAISAATSGKASRVISTAKDIGKAAK